MRKAMKKLVASVLVAVMLFSAAPLSKVDLGFLTNASAESYQLGENVYYTFDEETGLLTISGTGEMNGYFYVCPFSEIESLIKEVVIEDGITSIGIQAFYYCTSLTNIVIPDSVTSIGSSAFRNCESLTSIVIPDGVTSIGNYAFCDCTNLTNITIPGSVISIGDRAFYRCKSLTSITIPSGVMSIDAHAFRDCTSLTSVSISDSVTDLKKSAFLNTGYYNNEENWIDDILYIDSFVIDVNSSVSGELKLAEGTTCIAGSAFFNCNNLKSITLPDSVASIGASAFNNCKGLASITIPDSVTSIGESAFYGCESLTNITIPDSVTSIGKSAFRGCTGLTDITIPDSITSIESYTFYECSNLKNITIPDSVKSIGSYSIIRCTSLTDITIPSSVTSIGRSAFYECTGLINITIPSSVTYIGSYAFDGCTNLSSICFVSDKAEIAAYAIPNNENLQIFALKDSELYNTLTAQGYNVIPYGFTVNEDDKNKPMLALYSKVDFTRDMWSCIWQLIEDTDVEYVYFDELNIIDAMPEDVIECNTPDELKYKQVKFSVVKDNNTIRLWKIDEKTSYDGFVDALLNTVVRFVITLQQIISGAFRYIIRFFKK